jgi:hypothetical protein
MTKTRSVWTLGKGSGKNRIVFLSCIIVYTIAKRKIAEYLSLSQTKKQDPNVTAAYDQHPRTSCCWNVVQMSSSIRSLSLLRATGDPTVRTKKPNFRTWSF